MIATNLEQSKRLIELGVDPSTADMFYRDNGEDLKLMWELVVDKPKFPAWSLSALLKLTPYYIDVKEGRTIDDNPVTNERYHLHIDRIGLFGDRWKLKYGDTQERQYGKRFIRNYIEYYRTNEYNNLIDATFEMIIWLKENKYI